MKTIRHENAALGEAYLEAVHESGLRVYLCEKPAFAATYALFGTHYGSIDTKFRLAGEDDFAVIPEGTAHFLEHKLFESEEGDAFVRFAKTGGSANAYTSFDRTCYLFSCTERWEENLDILLDFVRHPYFTEQTVQKEQGIIGQEIRMYDDDPGWCVLFNMLQSMYREHPVRIDLAGTVESIAQINAEMLHRCYRTFYNPSNMFLCIAGPIDTDTVLKKVEAVFDGAEGVAVERGTFDEPDGVEKPYVTQEMAVAQPVFNLGFKENLHGETSMTLRDRVETTLLLHLLAGRSGRLYNNLLDRGLINDGFSAELFYGHGYAVSMFGGESDDPKAVQDAIVEELARMRSEGIDGDAFRRVKNALYGRNIMRYNSVERIASALVDCAIDGDALFDLDEVYRCVTKADLEQRLQERLDPANMVLSVVTPAK